MRRTLLLIAIATAAAWSSFDRDAGAGTLQLIRSIEFPAYHRLGTDLAWDGQYLWTSMEYSHTPHLAINRVRLDPADGSIISNSGYPHPAKTGYAWDGANVWETRSGYAWATPQPGSPPDTIPDYLLRYSPGTGGGASFPLPNSPDAWVKGAAFDGTYLWLSDAKHRQIMQVDPADMSVVTSFPSPGVEPRGLAWDGSFLWSVDSAEKVIHQIDTSGNVVDTWLASSLTDPFGVTFEGQYLWVLDNGRGGATPIAPKIIKFAIPEPSSIVLLGIAAVGAIFVQGVSPILLDYSLGI